MKTAGGYLGVLFAIGFVPLVGFFTFVIMATSPHFTSLAAFVNAILVFCAAGIVFCSLYMRQKKKLENYFLSEKYGTLKGVERREQAKKALREIREDAIDTNVWRTRKGVYGRAIAVVICLVFVSYLSKSVFGMYPADLFRLPPYVFIGLWAVFTLILPRIMLILLVFTLAGIALAFHAMGPQLIGLILPFLFLAPMNFLMIFMVMFGPLMIINILQIQIFKPTDARWGNTPDDVRGQKAAMRQLMSLIRIIASPKGTEMIKKAGERIRPRGILLFGPPGVGKTHSMRAMATVLNAPIMIIPSSAFSSAFMGVGIWTMFVVKFLAGILQRQYDYVVIFFDEAEQILMARPGVMGGGAGAMGSIKEPSMWDVLERDSSGRMASCGLGFIRENEEFNLVAKAAQQAPKSWIHHFMFPGGMMGGGGGGQMVQPVLLNWMDGIRSPSMMSRLWRGKINDLLTALWIPSFVRIGKTTLHFRIPPADAPPDNAVFVAATNMPHMIDAAFKRHGRFGDHVYYGNPQEDDREDFADLLFSRLAEKGILAPDMKGPERIKEFARATVGLAHVDIEQVTVKALATRNAYIEQLKELKERVDAKEELSDYEQRRWNRFKDRIGTENWDTLWVDWQAMSESLMDIRSGQSNPTITSPKHRETTAYHEFMGHLLPLKYFIGDAMRPVALSIMPRGEALGMVIHVPVEERDPEPQKVFDGLLRVMLGSTVAERLYFKDNQPGVSGDSAQATRLVDAMVGRFNMEPRHCSKEDWKRYLKEGKRFFSLAGVTPSPMGMGPAGSSLSDQDKRQMVLVLLGQAVIDVWRLIDKNKDIPKDNRLAEGGICTRLLNVDEIVGQELEDLWTNLDEVIKPLTPEDLNKWPDEENMALALLNPFYKEASVDEEGDRNV